MSSTSAGSAAPFGSALRRWRRARHISQLELSARVGSTSRHVSFLETGRSRPSRQMVLRLCEALEVPLRERNRLLNAAGLPAAYPEGDLKTPELAPYLSAVQSLLAAHDPFPAMAVDAHWNVVAANRAARALLGQDLPGTNMVRRYLADPRAADLIVNWPQVAWSGLTRLRHQLAQTPFDEELRSLAAITEHALAQVPPPPAPADAGIAVCPWFRVGQQEIRTISMVARFEPAGEVVLDELRIELTYPLDEAAGRFFRALTAESVGGA